MNYSLVRFPLPPRQGTQFRISYTQFFASFMIILTCFILALNMLVVLAWDTTDLRLYAYWEYGGESIFS